MLHSSEMPYEKRKRKKVQEDDPATFVIDVFLLITQKKISWALYQRDQSFFKVALVLIPYAGSKLYFTL